MKNCCRALTAECLACTENTSVKNFCLNNPDILGCEDITTSNNNRVIEIIKKKKIIIFIITLIFLFYLFTIFNLF
jgi:hypothetical protein